MGSGTHSTVNSAADATGTNSGGDPANPASEQGSALSGSANTPSPDAVPMHRVPEHHVGWQSLLPGSIQ